MRSKVDCPLRGKDRKGGRVDNELRVQKGFSGHAEQALLSHPIQVPFIVLLNPPSTEMASIC